jgi:hypothetical protein
LKRSVENSKENSKSSARWKRALEITGYWFAFLIHILVHGIFISER